MAIFFLGFQRPERKLNAVRARLSKGQSREVETRYRIIASKVRTGEIAKGMANKVQSV